MSPKSADGIAVVLRRHYASVGVSIVNDSFDLKKLALKKPDLVFMGMKYVPGLLPGSKIWVSEFLEAHNITHTGSPKRAIALEHNKPMAKLCTQKVGIPTADFLVVPKGQHIKKADVSLSYPMFIKPATLGGGKGIDDKSLVSNFAELEAKTNSITHHFETDALIEEYLPGREFSVGVLKDTDSDNYFVMPIEMMPSVNADGVRIQTRALKSGPVETPVLPVTDTKIHMQLAALATDVFHALGARDYGRIDIRLDAKGVPHFLEANLIPGLIENSGNMTKAALINKNMSYETLMLHIVALGLARADAAAALDFDLHFNLGATTPIAV